MLEYEEAPHAITGPQVHLYEYPEYSDICEAVTAAINDLSERQVGNRSVTIICDGYEDEVVQVVKLLGQLNLDTIFYLFDKDARKAGVTNATDERMKEWLQDRGNTILVTDMELCRGWEQSTVIVMDYGHNLDNICMRAVSNLNIIKVKDMEMEK